MLIHLTDPIQNTNFTDKYYAGIPIDLSKCLFVFSFNDIEKVNPILRDRMNLINVDFPDPVLPTIAVVSPAFISKFILFNTGKEST